MRIRGGGLPGLDGPVTECAVDIKGTEKVCSRREDITHMRDFLEQNGVSHSKLDDCAVVSEVKKILKVDAEAKIYEHPKFRKHIGGSRADKVLKTEFKEPGPANDTSLLDNFNIDGTIQKWVHKAPEKFHKKFYGMPFQMIDFAKTRTELSKLDLSELMESGYDCFGVVLNTDVSTGRGKHWFCLYCDLTHTGKPDDPVTIEYFNSSGFEPRPEITVWMESTCHDMISKYDIYCKIINVANGKQLQFSRTECGVWSLVYILSRLCGHDPDWIVKVKATDHDMIKYRKKLFRT